MRKKGVSLSQFILISFLLHAGLIALTYSYYQIGIDKGEQILLVNLMDTLSETGNSAGEKAEMSQNESDQLLSLSSPESELTEATVSLDAPGSEHTPYAPYLIVVKQKINTAWDYPESAQKARLDGSLALQFSISRTGIIKQVRLLRSSGYTELDDEAMRAIAVSSPFPPLPGNLRLSRLNILATFEYRIEHE
ncbi:MAG: energy transducer TonB [Proteobacteria bacterium]|nr:energy transducer TonB [Pseudomonadota bacterium]